MVNMIDGRNLSWTSSHPPPTNMLNNAEMSANHPDCTIKEVQRSNMVVTKKDQI